MNKQQQWIYFIFNQWILMRVKRPFLRRASFLSCVFQLTETLTEIQPENKNTNEQTTTNTPTRTPQQNDKEEGMSVWVA